MEKVHSVEQFNQLLSSGQPLVVVFKADWCKDCHFIEPFIDEVVSNYADRFAFIELDRDELPDVFAEHHVMGIPSFIAYKQGKELVRFVSKLQKTREEIEQFLDRAAAVSAAMPAH